MTMKLPKPSIMSEPEPTILELPNHITVEIFSRIPFPTLIQCRCVCKSWRRSLSDRIFAKYLLSLTPPSLIIKHRRSFFLVEPNSSSAPNGVVIKLAEDSKNSLNPHLEVVGSCNGFLVFRYNPGQFSISNPIIGEFLTLPRPSIRINCKFVCGFGYSNVSNVYKLVLVSVPSKGSDDDGKEVKVMTVGTRIWRSIGFSEYPHWYNSSSGVCVNGAIHWIVGIGQVETANSRVICAFDVETEQFVELPLPPGSFRVGRVDLELGVLNGCLTLNVCYDTKISVWMMKDYGREGSWTKEFEIREKVGGKFRSHLHVPQVLKFRAQEGQAVLLFKHELHAHNVGKRGLLRLEIDKIPSVVHGACVHTPSFLSLKHAIAS